MSSAVTAARIVAGAVLALWIIGGIAFLALRDGDSSNDNAALPTQPPSTSIAPVSSTTTTAPATTTTTRPPATTTTAPPPTISVVPPPPTEAPTTAAPTTAAPPPPTTVAPPPTSTTPPPTSTTKPPPPTTTPAQAAAKVQAKALQRIGDSNRGVPNDERVVVNYTPGQDLLITWAVNNGEVGEHPTGTPTCGTPPTDPPTTSSTTSTTTTTTTTTPGTETTTTTLPKQRDTQQQARFEANKMLTGLKTQITTLKLDITGVQLVGTYPIEGADASDVDVVQALYSKETVQQGNLPGYLKTFEVPPAEVVQCLNPAFEL